MTRHSGKTDAEEPRGSRETYEALLEEASRQAMVVARDAIALRDDEIEQLKKNLARSERELARVKTRLSTLVGSRSFRFLRRFRRIAHALGVGPRARAVEAPVDAPSNATGGRSAPAAEPEIPPTEAPEVSIIIPTYRNAVILQTCLRSIAENTNDVAYEVIVVDDDPGDDRTWELLQGTVNLKAIKNPENLGFLRSCNSGAALAAGSYIVFLNNDTVVQPGWLAALLRAARSGMDVGLVGSKLVYPNGRLQEAGGIVWDDATGSNYGRRDAPDRPAYNFLRETDYCSGACILVPRALFEEVGGFDERFAPAYYEDTDLAFTIRSRGYRVLYQPAATIIHVEGASHGRDISSGMKRYQEINRLKFLDKWRTVLERDHHPRGTGLFIARERRRGPRILVVDQAMPTYDRDSGSQRMYQLLRLLVDAGYLITFVPGNLKHMERYTAELQQLGIEVIYGRGELIPTLEAIGPSLSAVILSRPTVAATMFGVVRRYAPQAPIAYDSVDLLFVREARYFELQRQNGDDTVSRFRRLEKALVRVSDASIAITDDERKIMLSEVPGARVHVIPNVHEPREGVPPFSERRDLVFVGNFRHSPNEDAIRYFVSDIWPELQRQLRGVQFHIVGPDPLGVLKDLDADGVVIAGWVDDVDAYLDRMRTFVAPLRFGAGMKGKIGQSLAAGLPVVTTSVGAEGMHLEDGRQALIADDVAGFVERVVRVYHDEALWAEVAEAGIRHVERYFAPAVVRVALDRLLRELIGDSSRVA